MVQLSKVWLKVIMLLREYGIKSVEEHLLGIKGKKVDTHSLSYSKKKRSLMEGVNNGHNT